MDLSTALDEEGPSRRPRDLTLALRQLVGAAVEMVGAPYGAIAILDSDGVLDESIQVGVLPAATSLLRVPLVVRDQVVGHFYLVDSRADAFTDDDQQVVEALAGAAGVALAHARPPGESASRRHWTAASSRITHALVTDADVDVLQLIAETALGLVDADLAGIVLCEGGVCSGVELVVDRVAGRADDSVRGVQVDPHGLVGACLRTGHRQVADDAGATDPDTPLSRPSLGPALAVPLPAESGVRGCLFALRDLGSPTFTDVDLDMAVALGGHAALALDRAEDRQRRVRTSVLEDRDRIARDLHDQVVQRLFAVGLDLQGICALIGPGPAADRLSSQIDEMDATIRQMRSAGFGAHGVGREPVGVRARLLELIATASLARVPEVSFRGPVDVLVTEALGHDVVAVVREGLANVGLHAAAERVEVFVAADARSVSVEVLDDGRGLVDGAALSGLADIRTRAEDLGGSLTLTNRTGPGVRLRWTSPLEPAGA